jgi:glycerophosphoryl diester phosphodiesterase
MYFVIHSPSPETGPEGTFTMSQRPQIIAHRGASKAEKENTLSAFRRAGDMASDAVELDVRRTKDGAMAVHHDDHLADGRTIVGLNADELPDHVPMLNEALDACDGMWVNIEIKNWPEDADFDETDRLAASVARLLEERNEDARWVISAFHRPTVEAMRTLAPTVRTAWLTLGVRDEDIDKVARDLANSGHIAIHPWDRFLTRKCVDVCHSQGLQVNVWTVDDPDRMRELIEWGVDGIVTNVPDVALRVRAEFDGSAPR